MVTGDLGAQKWDNSFFFHVKKIYTSSNPTFSSNLSNLLPPVIDFTDNNLLCSIQDESEIKEALFSPGAHKLGPLGQDEMSVNFFK